MTINIIQIPAFDDNYLWLFHKVGSQQAFVVDPGDASPIEQTLAKYNLTLAGILVTHHHWDHTNGIEPLLKNHQVPVYGPHSDKISHISHPLREGDKLNLDDNISVSILEVPGHTLDHIAYYVEDSATGTQTSEGTPALFCGDTLFAAGCGRMFEGEANQMQASLSKLADLPGNTKIYCAHEYTASNLAFAAAVEPHNSHIKQQCERVNALRQQQLSTIPSTMATELLTNPFLRCHIPEVSSTASKRSGQKNLSPGEVFGELRRWKDHF